MNNKMTKNCLFKPRKARFKEEPGQSMEILGHKRIDSYLSALVRSDSDEEDWIKFIDMKSDYPIQIVRFIVKHYDFTPSNSRMISWAQVRIKKIKINSTWTMRSIRSMKARK